MTVRAFVPTDPAGLAILVAGGRLPAPLAAHAATEALRAAWPEADQEQAEYAALMAAAAASRTEPGARRHVLAVDTPRVSPGEEDDPTSVTLSVDLSLSDVAAAHVDLVEGADGDDDLAWFATQEISHLA